MPWNELYASLLQNTSLNMNDIMNMSIPQLEYILEGISKNNKKSETNSGSQEALDGADALEYLLQNNMKF